MGSIFAKFIFSAAYVFAGADQDLPPLVLSVAQSGDVWQQLDAVHRGDSPPCPVTPKPRPCVDQPPIVAVPRFCTQPGAYTVTVRLGLIAQTPLGGKVWLEGPGLELSILAAFTAAPGTPAYVAASLPVPSTGACYRIRLDASDAVEVMGDPRVSFLIFSR